MQEILTLYQNIPLHIDPIAFSVGFFSIRWYGLSYLAGFLVVYFVLMLRIKKHELKVDAQIYNLQFTIFNKNFKFKISNLVIDYLIIAFFAALLGGRLGYVLFYNAQFYLHNPLAIISPYDFYSGQYVGLFGMSYHGALLGVIVGSYFFVKKRSISAKGGSAFGGDFFAWADFVIPAVALGYFFGRMGNFLNGELYGRITNAPMGMYFVADPSHLRHPSQLYEALLEGLLLFAILWKIRNKQLSKGMLFAIYLIGYGTFRIIVEQFRQPDQQVGLLLNFFTMGQLLSVAMVFSGLFFLILKNEK